MTRETKVASIPDIRDDNVTEVLRAIKNVLEVREGHLGDALDQNATLRDLVDLSVLQTGGATSLTGGQTVPVVPTVPPVVGYNPATDYTTPPLPSTLRATGGFTNVYLEWDGAPYKNNAYTEIWRSSVDNLGTAVMIGTTAASVYADPAKPDTTYYYWIRFVSSANIPGPYNQTSGTVATTAIDVSAALSALSGELTKSQLFIDLGSRIASAETGIVSLRSIIGTSASDLLTLSSTVGKNSSSLQIQSKVVDGLSAQYTVKTDVNGHVAGFGLATTTNSGTPTSAFIVRADKFGIAGASTPGEADPLSPAYMPFIVTTTTTTINGKSYPAGTWIDTAFIANATITTAQIKELTADKITAGSVTAAMGLSTGKIFGGVAVSTNTSDGTYGQLQYPFASSNFGTGFFLGLDSSVYKFYVGSPSQNMNWNGSALTVTGNINATSGSFRNITIYDSSNNVILSSGGVPVSAVTGLGALATQSTVSTGQVTGLGGLATQNSVFVGSTVKFSDGTTMNTGDFVNKLTQITTSNVSTFIASAAIGDAYIGNLNASKITAGTIAADRLDASVINAKVTNIDAAVIGSGTIANARIGDLYAKKIYCGNATTAVNFVDPGYTSVALRSHAVGYLYYDGDTGVTITVPATCLDENGYAYDCSYTTLAAGVITGDSLKFKCVDADWSIDRRVRTGVVQFFVNATVTVDHYFSLWYRVNGGSWVHIGQATEQAGGYGTVGLQWSGSFTTTAGYYIEFGMSASNSSLNFWNSSNREIRFGAITVTAINF